MMLNFDYTIYQQNKTPQLSSNLKLMIIDPMLN